MDIEHLEKIIKILKSNDVNEFELETDGTHIKLTRGLTVTGVEGGYVSRELQPAILPNSATTNGASGSHSVAEQPINDNFVKVESPLVGTFYRKPGPDAEPFVNVGDAVRKGDTLCIVEAMKLMNEIESPCDGRIQKVLVQDGQVAEFGEILFLIDPQG